MSLGRPEDTDSSNDEMDDPADVFSPFIDDDDEGTMDEEEAVSDDNSEEDELDDLKKESEIPLDQLREMYASIEKGEMQNTQDHSKAKEDQKMSGCNGKDELQTTEDHSKEKGDQKMCGSNGIEEYRNTEDQIKVDQKNEVSKISSQEQQDLSKKEADKTSEPDQVEKTGNTSSSREKQKFRLSSQPGSSKQYLESLKMKSALYNKNKVKDKKGDAESRPGPSGIRPNSPPTVTLPNGSKRLLEDYMDWDQCEQNKSDLHLLDESLSENDEESSDEDYLPPDYKDRVIMVGTEFQAVIPSYSDERPIIELVEDDEEGDKLLWSPDFLPLEEVERYLSLVHEQKQALGGGSARVIHPSANTTDILKDDEQALFNLMKSDFKIEESLRRVELNAIPERGTVWSQEECTSFEEGICNNGKNFNQIHNENVKTRSTGEVCRFYYGWKNSDSFHKLVECKKKELKEIASQEAENNSKSTTTGLKLECEKGETPNSSQDKKETDAIELESSKEMDNFIAATNKIRKNGNEGLAANEVVKNGNIKTSAIRNIENKYEAVAANKGTKNGNEKVTTEKIDKRQIIDTRANKIIIKVHEGAASNKFASNGNERVTNDVAKSGKQEPATNKMIKNSHEEAAANKVSESENEKEPANEIDEKIIEGIVAKNKIVTKRNVRPAASKTKNDASDKIYNSLKSNRKGGKVGTNVSKRTFAEDKMGQFIDDNSTPNARRISNCKSSVYSILNNNETKKESEKPIIKRNKTRDEEVLSKKGVGTASITCSTSMHISEDKARLDNNKGNVQIPEKSKLSTDIASLIEQNKSTAKVPAYSKNLCQSKKLNEVVTFPTSGDFLGMWSKPSIFTTPILPPALQPVLKPQSLYPMRNYSRVTRVSSLNQMHRYSKFRQIDYKGSSFTTSPIQQPFDTSVNSKLIGLSQFYSLPFDSESAYFKKLLCHSLSTGKDREEIGNEHSKLSNKSISPDLLNRNKTVTINPYSRCEDNLIAGNTNTTCEKTPHRRSRQINSEQVKKNVGHVSRRKTEKIKKGVPSSDLEDNMSLDERVRGSRKRASKNSAKSNGTINNDAHRIEDENRKVVSLPLVKLNERTAKISKIKSSVVASRKRGYPRLIRETVNTEGKVKKPRSITRSSTGVGQVARGNWRFTSCLHCRNTDVKPSVRKIKRTYANTVVPSNSEEIKTRRKNASLSTDGNKSKNKRKIEPERAETVVKPHAKEEGVVKIETRNVKRRKINPLQFPGTDHKKMKNEQKRNLTLNSEASKKSLLRCNLKLTTSKRLKRGRPPKKHVSFDASQEQSASSSCCASLSESTSDKKKSLNKKKIVPTSRANEKSNLKTLRNTRKINKSQKNEPVRTRSKLSSSGETACHNRSGEDESKKEMVEIKRKSGRPRLHKTD